MNEDLITKNKQYVNENMQLRTELKIVKDELNVLEKENKKLNTKIDVLTNDNKTLNVKIDTLTNDNTTLNAKINKLNNRIDILTNENENKKLNIDVKEIIRLFQWIFIHKNTNMDICDVDPKYLTKCNKQLNDFEFSIKKKWGIRKVFSDFKKSRNVECHTISNYTTSECRQRLQQYCNINNLDSEHMDYANKMVDYLLTNLSEYPFETQDKMISGEIL